MAFFNVSNQLLQIDTGKVRTYLYNASQSQVPIYAGLGENQVLGQRYVGVTNTGASNPFGAPAIFMLVQYQSTANPAPVAAPAPVYWTDTTFTKVSGVASESIVTPQGIAGYLMLNTTDLTSLTATTLNGGLCLIQIAGYLKGAYNPTTTPGQGNWIIGSAGNWTSTGIANGTAPGVRSLGIQLTAVASGVCDVLVNCDII
jgi:hypothetical protein